MSKVKKKFNKKELDEQFDAFLKEVMIILGVVHVYTNALSKIDAPCW